MKKRFNIYSMGNLIIKDDTLEKIKKSFKGQKAVLNEITNLKSNEICFIKDPQTGRQWEYERVH